MVAYIFCPEEARLLLLTSYDKFSPTLWRENQIYYTVTFVRVEPTEKQRNAEKTPNGGWIVFSGGE